MADLLLSAEFDDQTIKLFDELDRRIAALQGNTGTATANMASGAGQSNAAMAMLAGAIGGVSAKLAEMAINALKAFPQFVIGATQLAAQAETTGVALTVVAGNAGYTAEQVADLRKKMVDLQIAAATTDQVLLKLAGAQLDLTKATDLANVALDVSTVMGKSEEEALARITHAIVTKNTLILGDMQLQFTAKQAYEEYAESIGTTASALTAVQQKEAFYYMTIKAGQKLTGARNAAMGTAGKLAANLGERFQNLQRELGKITLPAYTQLIAFLNSHLGQMLEWVDKNQDKLKEWGTTLGAIATVLIKVADGVLDIVGSLGQLSGKVLTDFILETSKILAQAISPMDDIDARVSKLGETAKQAGFLLAYAFTTGIVVIRELINEADRLFDAFVAVKQISSSPWGVFSPQLWAELKANFTESGGSMDDFATRVRTGSEQMRNGLAKSFGFLPDAAKDGTTKAAEGFAELEKAIKDAEGAVESLNKTMLEDLAKVAKQRGREDIDARISASRQREDIERRHKERIADISKSAQKQQEQQEKGFRQERLDLDKQLNQGRIDAEIAYRRQLADIATDYYYEIDELVRKNDAVGIVRAMRENKRQLDEAKLAKARDEQDRKGEYERDLKTLKESQIAERIALRESLEEQLQEAEEARGKDIENLNRSLARQKEDRDRHRAWEDADRKEEYDKQLAEMGKQFAAVEGFTAEHLQKIVAQHGQALGDVSALYDAFYAEQTAKMSQYANDTGLPSVGAAPAGTRAPKRQKLGPGGYGYGEGGYGAGGFGVATQATSIRIGERGAEAFMALPLSQTITHRMAGGFNVNFQGLTPQTETQIKPLFYELFTEMFTAAIGR